MLVSQEGILSSESEWSQHKKLIDFSARPGGFRRSLVSNLPYFMVQWDYKGEKGFGHVIEGVDDSGGKAGDADDQGAVDEGDKGGGKFPACVYFLLRLSFLRLTWAVLSTFLSGTSRRRLSARSSTSSLANGASPSASIRVRISSGSTVSSSRTQSTTGPASSVERTEEEKRSGSCTCSLQTLSV